LTYSRDGIDILPSDKSSNFIQHSTFKVKMNNMTTTLHLIYRPPSSNDMAGLVNIIRNVDPGSILIGDFNLPGIDWQNGTSDNKSKDFLEAAEEKFLEQLVDFPTHTKGNTLDLVLTNSSEMVESIISAGRIGKSDHEMLLIKLAGGPPPPPCSPPKPNWDRADWQGFREELAAKDWYTVLGEMNTEEAWKEIKTAISQLTEKYVPLKKQRPANKPIWMTREITRAIDRKRRLWRRKAPIEEYKEAEKKVRNLIRNAKRNFEKKLAASHGNSKPFYSYLKNKTESRTGIGPLNREEGGVTTDSREMANILNKFFSSVFTAEDTSQEQPAPERRNNTGTLRNMRIKVSDTRRLIKKLKTSGSPGPDKITARMLQEIAWEISPVLTVLFRKSLSEGVVPADWRKANITPIFKKGKKADPSNYRPVSLTSICGKLMEGHVKAQLNAHLKENSLIRDTQHGFIEGKSCTTNLLHFLEVLTKATDEGDSIDVVFLDFSKAFDKVPHSKLIAKLEGLGVEGKILAWIKQWLAGRMQRVVINGQESPWEEVKSGVPQGSLLGPVLFSVYINDIDLLVELITLLIKFADDTKLANIIRCEADRQRLQACLDALMAWAAKWGMAFNTAKCKVMHVGRHNPRHPYTMGGQVLETTECERDIGVLVRCDLKPSDQCAKAARTANAVLGQISRAFHYRDRWTFVKLYNLYVRPHLEFAVAAWSPWTHGDIDSLERVQKRAISMVSGLGNKTYEERLQELGLTTLEARRDEICLSEMFKIMRGISNVKSSTWFDPVAATDGGRQTRLAADPLNVKLPPARLEIRRNFFSVKICEKWNKLPRKVKESKNVRLFKMELKKLRANPLA